MNNQREKAIINNNQFKTLIACITWPTVINYGSGMAARAVGRDMWISSIISVISTMLLILILINVSRQYPGKTIIEYGQNLLGVVFSKLLGLLLFVYFFISATNAAVMYIHHLTDFLLPETPFLVVTVLHVAVICYFVWQGPEVIGRVSMLAFVLGLFFYILVFLAVLPEINTSRITPLFDSGVAPVIKTSFDIDTYIGFIPITIAMILPLVRDQKKCLRSAASGLAIGGALFVFYFISELMVMGPQVVALMRISSMDFVRSIQITQYLHRFEAFMVGLWYWSILTQAGILTYCAQESISQTFGIKKRPAIMILIFGVLMIVLTFYMGFDRVFFLNLREHVWQYITLPIQYGIPAVFLLALGIKKFFLS
ncbi:MAG: GerAB/ArcD/ProY family transporter [Methylocystaceae bacterium]